MGVLRLYRKFYRVSTSDSPNSYSLITPFSISADTYVAGTGGTNSNTLVESGVTLVEEETGIFYADLNPKLYSSDVTYDLVFLVQYTSIAPADKKLITRFRVMPFNIANQLDYEISVLTPIEYEIIGTYN
jgi:hypothetical protein